MAQPSRRTLLAAPAVLTLGGDAVNPAGPGRPLQLEPDGTAGALALLEAAVWEAAREYDTVPCADTARVAAALTRTAAAGAEYAPQGGAAGWLRAHARAQILYAQARVHMGYPADAVAILRDALPSARTSGDGETQALIWALSARMADRAGQHRAAVALAQRGRACAPGTAVALQLTVKTIAGAWSGAGRPDMVREAVRDAMEMQAAIGEADGAPRGWSFLDDGLHPADVALSAMGALAVVGERDDELLARALAGAEQVEPSHRAAVRIVRARDAINDGRDGEAAELVVQAAGMLPDPRSWLCLEVLDVGARVREEERTDELGAAMAAAQTWLSR